MFMPITQKMKKLPHNQTNNIVKEELVEEPVNNLSNEQCDSGKNEGECLFGCDDKGISKIYQ